MKIKCLIVDDEPLAREILESHIRQIELLELRASCKHALEAVNWLQKESVDLIFLDIKMPRLSGMDFLRTMKPKAAIIFTTAHREFAVESYELEALDYLVKPIALPRLLQAVNRYLKSNAQHPIPPPLPTSPPPPPEAAYLFLKANKKMIKVYFDDILYIESLKDYSRVFTKDQNVVTSKNLLYFEHRLPQQLFARIHKSYLLSLSKVTAYSSSQVEVEGTSLPIGRTYKQVFLKRML